MSESLKRKTVKGIVWSALERFSTAGVNFVIGLIIARLLSPEEYGIIAMLAVFMAISQSVIDSGFSNALVRKLDRTEEDYSTAFYFNIVVGLLMYGVLFLISPYIAQFYKVPELEEITKFVGLILIFNSCAIVQQAILTIKVDFKTQMIISLFSAVVSGGIGIIMAMSNWKVWALVGQMLSVNFFRVVCLWFIVRWIPKRGFSIESFRDLFGYGSKLLLAGLLETIYRNLYTIIIGRFFQPNILGLYSRGDQIAAYPSSNITGVVQRVTFPVFSKLQNEQEKFREAFQKIIKNICFMVFPVMILLIVIAKPLVILVLTEKWIDSVPIIQILSLSFMWYPVHILNLNILQVSGRSDLFLRIEIIKKILGITVLFLTIPLGIIMMCWGRVAYCFCELFINMYYSNRILGLNYLQQLKLQVPIFIYSILVGIITILCMELVESNIFKIVLAILLLGFLWIGMVRRLVSINLKEIFVK